MDPIEEELKHARRKKLYQQYQAQLDELDKSDKENSPDATGELQGKKVTKLNSENSSIESLFDSKIKKKSTS